MNSVFKVLVVEDDSDDFAMLQRSLRRTRTFDFTWESSAAAGLSQLDQQLRESQQQVRREPELRRLDSEEKSTSGRVIRSESAPMLLKTTNTKFFSHAVAEYEGLIDKALELRDYKVEYNITTRLKALADVLTGVPGQLCLYYRSQYALAASGSTIGSDNNPQASPSCALVSEES